MYLQEILEVAIGLVFIWLVMSVAAMTFQEWIGNALAWRANALEESIRGMLASGELTEKLYEHPLIASLCQSVNKSGTKLRLPSYIPSAKFASALFDIISQAGTEASPLKSLTSQIEEQLSAIQNPEQQKLAKEDWTAILETAKQVAASGVAQAAVDSLKVQIQAYSEKYSELQTTLDTALQEVDALYQKFLDQQQTSTASSSTTDLTIRQFRLGLLALEGVAPKLNETVTALLRSAEAYVLQSDQAISEVRTSIESWFDDVMDRLSGAYKRKAQLVSFIIGFVLALLLNVDSIYVATSLWREPTLRQAIVAQAETYVEQNEQLATQTSTEEENTTNPLQTISELQQQLQVLAFPVGWTTTAIETGGAKCTLFPLKSNQIWGIPGEDEQGAAVCKRISNLPVDLTGWLCKILGLIITGAATAQGAPFWFDILKKIINVRSSGPNPSEQTAAG